MISGSAVSNVASVGVFTIPMMKRTGYSREGAGAIEAVGSTGGQLMPPVMGAAAFLMAEFIEAPYAEIALAAAIPAALYYLALYWQVDLIAGKENHQRLNETIPDVRRSFAKAGIYGTVPGAVVRHLLLEAVGRRSPRSARRWRCSWSTVPRLQGQPAAALETSRHACLTGRTPPSCSSRWRPRRS